MQDFPLVFKVLLFQKGLINNLKCMHSIEFKEYLSMGTKEILLLITLMF